MIIIKKNDQFGMLGDQPFNSSEMKEMNAIEISKADFEREWKIN